MRAKSLQATGPSKFFRTLYKAFRGKLAAKKAMVCKYLLDTRDIEWIKVYFIVNKHSPMYVHMASFCFHDGVFSVSGTNYCILPLIFF